VRVVVFGAGGRLGGSIVEELRRRHHAVLLVVRPGRKRKSASPGVASVVADVTDPASVREAVRGAEVVVSAIGPASNADPSLLTSAAAALRKGLRDAGVVRLIVVGGAGSLEVRPGTQLLETPDFPEAWKPVALAHRDALGILRGEQELEWTVVSPAAKVEPGERTGHYRAGGDGLLIDDKGQSRISLPDFAVAVVDEVETPRHIRRRFTVAAAG
jgi:uncharacterized protein